MIQLNHTTLLYGTVIGVNDFHIELPAGAYALVGPNGAGKSTLIGLLTGALRPTLGNVRLYGVDPSRDSTVLQRVGLCPASELLVHGVTAYQWVKLHLSLSGWPIRRAAARADEVLELVGMTEASHRPIHTFSLGMRQRCKLAQALANDPDLLILDEPFNGLDPIGRHEMSLLLKQWVNAGKSLLLASHVLHEVERITNSFMLIYGGRLLACGTSAELRHLLAGLPQEITIQTSTPNELAERLVVMPWLRSLNRGKSDQSLRISVERPLDLYQNLAVWAQSGEVDIQQLSGSDGDISALFHLLVSKHRGEILMTGVSA